MNDIRAVANADFLDSHPDIRSLLEQVKIDLGWIATQNERMAAGGYTQRAHPCRCDAVDRGEPVQGQRLARERTGCVLGRPADAAQEGGEPADTLCLIALRFGSSPWSGEMQHQQLVPAAAR